LGVSQQFIVDVDSSLGPLHCAYVSSINVSVIHAASIFMVLIGIDKDQDVLRPGTFIRSVQSGTIWALELAVTYEKFEFASSPEEKRN
jgi:hypothetical protein